MPGAANFAFVGAPAEMFACKFKTAAAIGIAGKEADTAESVREPAFGSVTCSVSETCAALETGAEAASAVAFIALPSKDDEPSATVSVPASTTGRVNNEPLSKSPVGILAVPSALAPNPEATAFTSSTLTAEIPMDAEEPEEPSDESGAGGPLTSADRGERPIGVSVAGMLTASCAGSIVDADGFAPVEGVVSARPPNASSASPAGDCVLHTSIRFDESEETVEDIVGNSGGTTRFVEAVTCCSETVFVAEPDCGIGVFPVGAFACEANCVSGTFLGDELRSVATARVAKTEEDVASATFGKATASPTPLTAPAGGSAEAPGAIAAKFSLDGAFGTIGFSAGEARLAGRFTDKLPNDCALEFDATAGCGPARIAGSPLEFVETAVLLGFFAPGFWFGAGGKAALAFAVSVSTAERLAGPISAELDFPSEVAICGDADAAGAGFPTPACCS